MCIVPWLTNTCYPGFFRRQVIVPWQMAEKLDCSLSEMCGRCVARCTDGLEGISFSLHLLLHLWQLPMLGQLSVDVNKQTT